MAIGDYVKTTYNNNGAPAITATRLNNAENKIEELDDALLPDALKTSIGATATVTASALPIRDTNAIIRNPQVNPNKGLFCAPSAAIPWWPDSVAGTTYIQDEWSTTDSWSGANCSISTSAGKLVMTSTAAIGVGYYSQRAVSFTGKGVIVRLRASSSGQITLRSYVSSVFVVIASITVEAGVWYTLSGYETGLSTLVSVRKDTVIANETIELDWVYIGTGAYDSKALDLSGNDNHMTPYAVTPVAGLDGRSAFYFNGANSLMSSPASFASLTAFSISCWVKHTLSSVVIAVQGTTSIYAMILQTGVTAGKPSIRVSGDGANLVTATSNAATINDGQWHHIVGTFIGGTSLNVYVDGILAGTNNSGIPASIFASTGLFRMGVNATGTTYYEQSIGETKLYDHALTAAEVWAMYEDSGKHNLNNITLSQTAVPYSVPIRNSSGNLELNIPSVNGIKFPATQAASSDANTLDDYEEGTFTPGISFGGLSTGITYSSQVGYYTKVGNRIICNFRITLSSKGSAIGNALITGFPFTTAATTFTAVTIAYLSNLAFSTHPSCYLDSASTSAPMVETTVAGSVTALTNSDFSATTYIIGSVSYQAT